MADATPVFVGQAHLRLTDLLNLRAWRGLLVFLVSGSVLGVYALSKREPYEGPWSHHVAGGLAILSGVFLLAGLVVLAQEVAAILRLRNPSLEVRFFVDHIEFFEQGGKAGERRVEEHFSEYTGYVEDPRGLFLHSHRPPSKPRQSFIPRACFRENWDEVRIFALARVPGAAGTSTAAEPKQKTLHFWLRWVGAVAAFLLLYLLLLHLKDG